MLRIALTAEAAMFTALIAMAIVEPRVAEAQIVERNLPPAPERQPVIRLETDDLRKSADDTTLGVDLRGVVVIGAKDAVIARPNTAGVDARRVEGVDPAAIRGGLAPFLGRPLTRRLISEAQSAVAAAYREAGRPFVSVTAPPQEVTSGVLQLRVFPFHLGEVTVKGASPAAEERIRNGVRVTPGAVIEAQRLETDLDWLNRNPFRQVEAIFGPGKELAQTELTLQTRERRPWQVFAGYSNSGTRLTDRDRIFASAAAAAFGDVLASYQLTGSKDFWSGANGSSPLSTSRAQYMSHAGRIVVPLWPRSSLEIVADYVQTNERPNVPFRIRTGTGEIAALYRTAVSNLLPFGFGDFIVGAEFKQQKRETFFAETLAATGSADVMQVVAGWTGRWADRFGGNDLDIRIKMNPGGVLPSNANLDWARFTNGRVTEVRAVFADLTYSRRTPLPQGASLLTEVIAQFADQSLPDTERAGLGGALLVRGYVTEDGTEDRAFVVRNSLYLPPLTFPTMPVDVGAAPFVFVDVGSGRDLFLGRTTTLASAGVGLDGRVGPFLAANLSLGYALRDGPFTPQGSWLLQAKVTASY